MKPKDIIVGQKYRHSDFANTVYIGIEIQSLNHKRDMSNFDNQTRSRKALLILSGPLKFKTVIRRKCDSKWWKKFSPISS